VIFAAAIASAQVAVRQEDLSGQKSASAWGGGGWVSDHAGDFRLEMPAAVDLGSTAG